MSTRPFEPDLIVEQPAPNPKKRARAARARPAATGGAAKRAKKRTAAPRDAQQEPLLVLDDAAHVGHLSGTSLSTSASSQGGGLIGDEVQLDPALFALDSLYARSTAPLASSSFDNALPTPPAPFYDATAMELDPELTQLVARLSESAPPPDPAAEGASQPSAPSPDAAAAPETRSRTASAHSYISIDGPALVGSVAPCSYAAPSPAPAEPEDPRAHDIPVKSPERPDGKRRRALKWSAEEDAALLRLKEDTPSQHILWQEVAERIGTRHTGVQCRARYLLLKDKEKIRNSTEDNLTQGSTADGKPLALRRRLPFRESDDAVLLSHLVDASFSLKHVDWSVVGQTLDPPRTGDSCYQRARKLKLRHEAELAVAGSGPASAAGSAHASAAGTPAPVSAGELAPLGSAAADDGVATESFEEALARALQGDVSFAAAEVAGVGE